MQFSRSVVSNSLWPHGLQHTMLPCPSPTPGAYSNSWPLSWWCHPTISSSVVSSSSCLQSFLVSGSFPTSQFFTSGSQSIGVSASASVLSVNIQTDFLQDWQVGSVRKWEVTVYLDLSNFKAMLLLVQATFVHSFIQSVHIYWVPTVSQGLFGAWDKWMMNEIDLVPNFIEFIA